MSLKISSISLNSWRNFKDFSLELAPGLTILVGPNAVGKTNTIEALQYLTAATSFRKPSPLELINEGNQYAQISAVLEGDGRKIDVEMSVTETSRKFFCNGKSLKTSEYYGILNSVLFNPDDLLLIKGSASKRRDELDNFGIQIHSGYRKVYSTYMRSIEQRNHLLKDGVTGELLSSWDQSVALGAATLMQQRIKMFIRLSSYIKDIYNEITPNEQLDCLYSSSVLDFPEDGSLVLENTSLIDMTKSELAAYIEKKLFSLRDEELRRAQTLIGPHRDDVSFLINKKDARKYGSQGQQRSIVLAWKLAEVKLCQEIFNNCPVLLLDDVMSELDESRRSCITRFIKDDIQTVITTTNIGYFDKDQLDGAKVVSYE